MQIRPSIEEIEKRLGLDTIQPIQLAPGHAKDLEEDEDTCRKWYEEELRKLYEQYEKENK